MYSQPGTVRLRTLEPVRLEELPGESMREKAAALRERYARALGRSDGSAPASAPSEAAPAAELVSE